MLLNAPLYHQVWIALAKAKNNLLQLSGLITLLSLISLEIINVFEVLGDSFYIREFLFGGDYLRPRDGLSFQDFLATFLILSISIWLYQTNNIRTTVIPEEVAVKLVQKAKVAEKKTYFL